MKTTLLIICMAFVFSIGSNAQSQKTVQSEIRPNGSSKAENYAEIKFDTLRCNFGTFPASEPIGTSPLIINQAFASCGCTVPSYTKDPIKPGESGTIDVTYNGTGLIPGRFSKTITIRSNAKNRIVRLVIEGEMTDK